MSDVSTDLMTLIQELLNGNADLLSNFGDSPVDLVEATAGVPGDVDPSAVVAQALAGTDLDPATQQAVLDAVNSSAAGYGTADDGYTADQLAEIFAQGINITVEEGDEIYVDNSLHVEGDVKGGIHQNNYTDITQADDGSIIADGATGSNFQTGEGNVQLTDVHADNITTGDNNTVASDYGIIGDENVNAEYIANSEFGEGDQDRSVDVDVAVTDSGNYDSTYTDTYTDDDYTNTKVDLDVDGYGQPAPAPYVEAKPVYEPEPEYDEPVYEAPKPVYEEPKPVYEEEPYQPDAYYEPKPEPVYEPEPEPYDDYCGD
ncbi:MAG: hypothetical protein AAF962_18675 [Actinomycetota bacterium]